MRPYYAAGTRQVLSSRTPKAINTIQGQAPSGRHRLRTTRVAAAATQQASSSFEAARVVEFQHMGSSSSDGCGSRYSRSGGKKSFLTVAAAAAATIIVVSDQGRAAHYARPEGLQASNRDVEPLKMVLCVNQSLKMGKGKIGAQCAHAAIGVVLQLLATDVELYQRWEQCGQRKIVVKVDNTPSMEKLLAAAMAAGLPTYMMRDAGRTQVAPGSQTVLAVGPGREADLDRLTRHLQLL